jgi:hypothetical protein
MAYALQFHLLQAIAMAAMQGIATTRALREKDESHKTKVSRMKSLSTAVTLQRGSQTVGGMVTF